MIGSTIRRAALSAAVLLAAVPAVAAEEHQPIGGEAFDGVAQLAPVAGDQCYHIGGKYFWFALYVVLCR